MWFQERVNEKRKRKKLRRVTSERLLLWACGALTPKHHYSICLRVNPMWMAKKQTNKQKNTSCNYFPVPLGYWLIVVFRSINSTRCLWCLTVSLFIDRKSNCYNLCQFHWGLPLSIRFARSPWELGTLLLPQTAQLLAPLWEPLRHVFYPQFPELSSRIRFKLPKVAEKAMAPHSSTLAWKIPWTEEPGRLQSMGSLRVGHDWATSLSLFLFFFNFIF